MFEIKVKLTTVSSCLIGNQTESFSVGGTDQSTTIDENGRPIIHGSSFKGALRNIIRENEVELPETQKYIECILTKLLEKYKQISQEGKIEKLVRKIENYKKEPKAHYIFGIEGINNMPRIYCSDFRVRQDEEKDNKDYFRYETKNTLREEHNTLTSLPRTYRVVKPKVNFEGILRFRDVYFNECNVDFVKIKKEIQNQILKFNDGFYGIGNSKSRGYGQVKVIVK